MSRNPRTDPSEDHITARGASQTRPNTRVSSRAMIRASRRYACTRRFRLATGKQASFSRAGWTALGAIANDGRGRGARRRTRRSGETGRTNKTVEQDGDRNSVMISRPAAYGLVTAAKAMSDAAGTPWGNQVTSQSFINLATTRPMDYVSRINNRRSTSFRRMIRSPRHPRFSARCSRKWA